MLKKHPAYAVAEGSDAGLGVHFAATHALWHTYKAAKTLSLLPRAPYAAQPLTGQLVPGLPVPFKRG